MAHARERNLKHAPIAEAVIDLRVRTHGEFSASLADLRKAFEGSFEFVEEHAADDEIGGAATTFEARALIFRSESTNEALQLVRNGFSFSKLRPYTSWEQVSRHGQEIMGNLS